MWLCTGIVSGLVCSTDLVKVSNEAASLLVCTRKKIFCLGGAGFCFLTSVTKNTHPKQKNFFRVQSTRLTDPFESLNSSLAQSAEELRRW